MNDKEWRTIAAFVGTPDPETVTQADISRWAGIVKRALVWQAAHGDAEALAAVEEKLLDAGVSQEQADRWWLRATEKIRP
jgi:hypothetical protein